MQREDNKLVKAIFLDRDGVLNKTIFRMGKQRAPYTFAEAEVCEGVPLALSLLKSRGFLLIVVTNQPDAARGWISFEMIKKINEKILSSLPIDDVKICFHTEADNCNCRKPRPGMLLESHLKWGIDLKESFMIGDRGSDIEAGLLAGCKTILITQKNDAADLPRPHHKAPSLLEAAQWICETYAST